MGRKDDQIRDLESLLMEADHTTEGLASALVDIEKTADRLDAAIKAAIEDLRSLQHVPANQLLVCVGEIIGALKAVL